MAPNVSAGDALAEGLSGLFASIVIHELAHSLVARQFGVLRGDGTGERALFVVDKKGIIRFIAVGDINRRPDLKEPVDALEAINDPGKG